MIRLLNVTKTVRSGDDALTILDDVSFEVPNGQFVSVTGASGSGKSTLLGLIAGLDAPTSGSIFVDDDEITGGSEDDLARIRSEKIGFVFQSFHLIPSLTAYENVAVALEIRGLPNVRHRALNLLEHVGLSDRGHHYPSQLSGGEQQRVAIARAFANSPRILLADEPTGNLDSRTGHHIFELMKALHTQHGVTLMLVTHDPALAAQAQRQIILADGRVISDGLREEETDSPSPDQ
jgi:putative ABC transport system ATP-binding protein